MSSFILKIIAVISMIFDHSGYAIFNNFSAFNYIGRLAFPIFAFQLTEGYSHTKNLKKYFLRLFLFAIISEIPFLLFRLKYIDTAVSLNIFFTLTFGLLAIYIYDKNKIIGIFTFLFSAIIAELLKFDYGIFGITIIFIFHVFKDNKLLMNLSFIFIAIMKYMLYIVLYFNTIYFYIYLALCISTISSLIFINLYNGKEGKKIKYLLYIFYPLHLLILYLL